MGSGLLEFFFSLILFSSKPPLQTVSCILSKKKVFSTRIDNGRLKVIEQLAVDANQSLGNLLEEVISDLVKKCEKSKK